MPEETTPPDADEATEGTDNETTPPADGDALGDAGKRALEAERKARRDAEQALKAAKARLDEVDDAKKSDIEKLTEQVSTAKQEAMAATARALRLEVAIETAPEGMSLAKVKKLASRLQGDSREDLIADAEDLFAEFAPTKAPPTERPRENLQAAGSSDDEAVDAEAIAAKIFERGRI